MSKAQVVSGDFTISLAIFIAILVIVLPIWSYAESQARGAEERRDIESSLLIITDVLTKTPGLPNDWNTSNVKNIGLADSEGILNTTKVLNFINMDYNEARDLLGISGYGFYIILKDIDDNNLTSGVCNSPVAYFSISSEDVKPFIANKGVTWDYYYGGSGSPETNDNRNFYNDSKVNAFNTMLSNRDLYKTIILEEADLQEGEVDIDNLMDFISLGGILIIEGNATLIRYSFGVNADLGSNREGTVIDNAGFVMTDIGNDVSFDDADWALYQGSMPLRKLIVDESDNNALVGYWDYGFGRIYYISDINGTVSSEPLELNLIGNLLEFGVYPSSGTITKAQRLVILAKEKNNAASMNVVLWK